MTPTPRTVSRPFFSSRETRSNPRPKTDSRPDVTPTSRSSVLSFGVRDSPPTGLDYSGERHVSSPRSRFTSPTGGGCGGVGRGPSGRGDTETESGGTWHRDRSPGLGSCLGWSDRVSSFHLSLVRRRCRTPCGTTELEE